MPSPPDSSYQDGFNPFFSNGLELACSSLKLATSYPPIMDPGTILALIEIAGCVVESCAYYINRVRKAKEEIALLLQEVKAFLGVLDSLRALVEGPNGRKAKVTQILLNDLESCSIIFKNLEAQIDPKENSRASMRTWGLRSLKWPLKSWELEKVVGDVERFKSTFSLALTADQINCSIAIDHNIALSRLQVAKGTTFDAYENPHDECLDGTRVELLQRLENWARAPNDKCTFWLNGRPGTGKSTISRTIANRLHNAQLLGASFFFRRGEVDLCNAQKLFPTIVRQLVVQVPQLVDGVEKAIEEDNNISEKTLREQFQKLLLQPLQELKQSVPATTLVVVIDALDECEREDDIRAILRLLPQVQSVNSVRLRFLLTGRPELPIRLGFGEATHDYEDLILHEIQQDVVERDIALFLRHRFSQIKKECLASRVDLPHNWPGEENFDALVKMSVPLFISAATACRVIQDPQWHPEDSLKEILLHRSHGSQLDQTYLPVLERITVSQTSKKTRILIDEYRSLIGTILVLQTPLPIDPLSELSNISKSSMQQRLNSLHSVISVPDDEIHPVRIFHLSFRDFLLDEDTRNKTPFWIDETEAHRHLAARCIEIMRQDLTQNICRLPRFGTLYSEIDKQSIQSYLQPSLQYSCQYWVRHLLRSDNHNNIPDAFDFLKDHLLHWIEAMSILGAGSEVVGILASLESATKKAKHHPEISQFLYEAGRFMLRNRYIAETAPLQIYSSGLTFCPRTSIIRTMFQNDIPNWIRGCPNIEKTWSAVIQTLQAPAEVDSLAFSPDGQLLASCADNGTVQLWNPTTGTLLQTLTYHNQIVKVALSARLVASGSLDGTIKMWEYSTGELQFTLEAHTRPVQGIAFSRDGLLLGSGSSDGTIKLRSTTSGQLQQTLNAESSVLSLAFSQQFLASGAEDKTVKIWDPVTGKLQLTLEGHEGAVYFVSFSLDNEETLASASSDTTVKIWSSKTGKLQQTLHHEAAVRTVAFAPDGTTLVSSAVDATIRVWNYSTGELLNALHGRDGQYFSTSMALSPVPTNVLLATASVDSTITLWDPAIEDPHEIIKGARHTIQSMAFSTDRKLLAAGYTNGSLQLWDPQQGEMQWSVAAHSGVIECVIFSPDGTTIGSSSNDASMAFWDVKTGARLQRLIGHTERVGCMAFSPDGKTLASGSTDKTVRLWDCTTGEPELQPTLTMTGHRLFIFSLAFSPDGQFLASGSGDKTVRIWDAATGHLEQTLHGHSIAVRSVAFSNPESTSSAEPGPYCQNRHGRILLASGSDTEIILWDPFSASLLQTFRLPDDGSAQGLIFSRMGPFLDTNRGRFCVREWYSGDDIGNCSSDSSTHTATSAEDVFAQEEQWICLHGKKVLYLPAEYRYLGSAVTSSTVALGDPLGILFVSAA